MRVIRVSLGLLLGTVVSLFGQGSVNFSNSGANDSQKVRIDSLSGALAPAGADYSVALYFSLDGILDDDLFIQVGSVGNFVGDGVFDAGSRLVPITVAGGFAMFQVRAWSTAGGNTWEQAFAQAGQGDDSIKLGKSNVFRVDTANPFLGESPAGILAGLQGFAVSPIPEPSPFMLGLLGAGILWFVHRQGKSRTR